MKTQASGNVLLLRHKKGVALITTLLVLFFLTMLGASILGMVYSRLSDLTLQVDSFKAMCLAEAGMAKAFQEQQTGVDLDANGIGNISATRLGEGFFQVFNNPEGKSLTAIGVVNGVKKTVFVKYG